MNEKDDIFDNSEECRDFAPHLAKIKRQNPFEVPENYFDELPSIIQEKCSNLEEIKGMAPLLSSIQKENSFEVPENYFDQLPYIIQEKLNAEKNTSSWIQQLMWIIKPKFAIPITISMITLIATLTFEKKEDTPSTAYGSYKTQDFSISYEEVSNSYYLNDIDEKTLIEEINDEDIGSQEEDRDIENYLIDHNTDVSQIINQL